MCQLSLRCNRKSENNIKWNEQKINWFSIMWYNKLLLHFGECVVCGMENKIDLKWPIQSQSYTIEQWTKKRNVSNHICSVHVYSCCFGLHSCIAIKPNKPNLATHLSKIDTFVYLFLFIYKKKRQHGIYCTKCEC